MWVQLDFYEIIQADYQNLSIFNCQNNVTISPHLSYQIENSFQVQIHFKLILNFIVQYTNSFRWISISFFHTQINLYNFFDIFDKILKREHLLCLKNYVIPLKNQIFNKEWLKGILEKQMKLWMLSQSHNWFICLKIPFCYLYDNNHIN